MHRIIKPFCTLGGICWVAFLLSGTAQALPLPSLEDKYPSRSKADTVPADHPPSRATTVSPTHSSLAAYEKRTPQVQLKLGLSTGLRYDQLQWSTSGTNNRPNILSELEWSDVMSYQLSFRGSVLIGPHFYGRGHFNYAFIDSGEVRDSDYGADDRNREWSRSISETNGDQLWDGLVGGGYAFKFKQKRFFIAPVLGFSVHKQNLRITNGYQVVSETPPPGYDAPPAVGPLSGNLNSMYRAEWSSMWAGCDLRYELVPSLQKMPTMILGLALTYHFWTDYDGEAEWNLRSDLDHPISFEHDADPHGISLQLEWLIRLPHRMHIHFNFDYAYWTADGGTVTTYVIDQTNGTVNPQISSLNEVTWQSHSVMIGATYRF